MAKSSPSRWAVLRYWRSGVRLYIAIAAVLVTLEGWWWAEASYGGSVLFATRLEELYAWLALGLLILAVSIGPVYSTWPRLPGKQIMSDARRLLGVSAAWFASLHVTIAYVSLFKLANPLDLPKSYQLAFVFGSIAMLILLAMAFTSFDAAFNRMGKWWFRLHRFVYLAIILTLLHAFMIGTHATELTVLRILSVAAVGIYGLHFYLAFVRRERPTVWQVIALVGMLVLLILAFHYGYHQHAIASAENGNAQ